MGEEMTTRPRKAMLSMDTTWLNRNQLPDDTHDARDGVFRNEQLL